MYILYSKKIDSFYIGETQNLNERLRLHNTAYFKNTFTKRASDWQIVFSMQCNNRVHARKIERHIKQMKSRTYIQNLVKYPEMSTKLFNKYK